MYRIKASKQEQDANNGNAEKTECPVSEHSEILVYIYWNEKKNIKQEFKA